jgi:DNA-binding NarL/FixJ family response regulator
MTRPNLLVDIAAAGSLRQRIVRAVSVDGIAVARNGTGPAAGIRVVAVDLSAPVGRLQEALRGSADARVVAVSPGCGPLGLRRALRAGATAVVLEEELEGALAPAVRAVAAGLSAVPAAVRHDADRLNFSHREREVLRLAIHGHTNDEIASALFLAESTVKSHLSSAYRKLGAGSRKDAATVLLDPNEGLGDIVLGRGLSLSSAPQAQRRPDAG